MKNPKLTWKIINSLNGVPILLYLFTLMHWPVFYRFTVVHIIIMVAVIYGLKSWIEVKYNMSSPIKNNKTIKMMYFISGALVLFGFLFRVLHWPFSNSLLIIGFSGVIISFIAVFFVDDLNTLKTSNPEILDDI